MALTGRYISIKEIAERLYGDTGLEQEIIWEDIIRWTVQALNKVGHPLQYKRRVTGYKDNPNLAITNYRAKIPCNVYKIEQIAVNGCIATYSNNTFHHLLGGECCGLDLTSPTNSLTGLSDGLYIDGFGNEFAAGYFSNLAPSDITYDLNDEYITLSCKEGYVCIAYLEFPVDKEGLPLIPEDEAYQEAVTRYLTMKIDYIAWRQDSGNQGKRALYEDSKQQWTLHVGRAANKAKSLNVDQMERLKNQMVRTFRSYNHHSSGFKYLGTQQQRRIK